MGIDEMGIDEMGVDEMGSRRSGNKPDKIGVSIVDSIPHCHADN